DVTRRSMTGIAESPSDARAASACARASREFGQSSMLKTSIRTAFLSPEFTLPTIGHQLLTGQQLMYGQCMLTLASRVDVMNRLGRAMADPTRSRILLSLLVAPGYPAKLA